MNVDDLQIESWPVGHLPVITSVLDQLGIPGVIDEYLPRHPLQRVSDSDCVRAIVLNLLSGRTALFRMEKWFLSTDAELVLGEGVPADALNDTRLGGCLDHLDAVGTDTLLSAVVGAYLSRSDAPDTYTVHMDTTTVKLFGAYGEGQEPQPAKGYSKDHRPDLLQLVFGLSLHGAMGLPLSMSIAAGNTSDTASNRSHIAKLAAQLPDEDDVTLVGDSKLTDPKTLGQLLQAGFHFLTLLPRTYSQRRRLIERLLAEEPDPATWPELARRPGRRKDLPDLVHRGRSFIEPFTVIFGEDDDGTPIRSTEELRFVVVHSTSLAAQFDRSLDKRLRKDLEPVTAFNRRPAAQTFACEADARAAAQAVAKKCALHTATVHVERVERPAKRSRPGRPRKGEVPPPPTVSWRSRIDTSVDDDLVDQLRRREGCFVLLTDNHPPGDDAVGDTPSRADGYTDADIVRTYRQQSMIENHTGFRWLKNEAAIAPVFLEKPTRIRALGLLFVFALFVRNYLQFTLRRGLQSTGETLPHPFTKKPVDNLTTEMALAHFNGLVSMSVALPGTDAVRRSPPLSDTARRLLEIWGLPETCFTQPRAGPSKLEHSRDPTPGM